MPQITFNIELNSKPDKFGRWSVMIRLHLKGQKPGRVLTSVKIPHLAKYWHAKKWGKWVQGHQDEETINQEIEAEYNRIKKQVKAWQFAEPEAVFTPSLLAERFRAGIYELYYDWVDKVLEDAKDQAYSTYLAKRSAINMFRRFAGEDLPLQSVTPVLVRQFQEYLIKTPNMKLGDRRKGSSVNKVLDRLHVIHKAILVKTGISPKQAEFLSPWTDIIPVQETKPRKAKLSETTIEEVANIKISSKRRRVTPEKAFVIWMISHTFAGMRFSDVMQLRYRNFTVDKQGTPVHLKYEMLKTGNVVSIPVFAEGWELLKPYWKAKAKPTDFVLPYLDNKEPYAKLVTNEAYRSAPFEIKRKLYNTIAYWNRQVNICLKQIQQEAGLTETLRTHNARHSFADLARRIMEKDGSLTMYDIQKMMGHSSLQTTEIYTKSLEEPDSTKAMTAIFNRKRS